jgi:hypothetical protein
VGLERRLVVDSGKWTAHDDRPRRDPGLRVDRPQALTALAHRRDAEVVPCSTQTTGWLLAAWKTCYPSLIVYGTTQYEVDAHEHERGITPSYA